MRLKPEQLEAALGRVLAPIYFISGEEPLQLGEAADAIRQAARREGYLSREIFSSDAADFAWNQLAVASASLSIFADKKIIDLRLPSGTVGVDGAKALTAYCGQLPEDTLLLISAGKLAKDAQKSRWMQALDAAGVVVQVWPLEGQELLRWLQQRLQRRGLSADQDGLRLLASRVEGNLLAAAQDIEKLYVLHGTGHLSGAAISDAVADSSRYDVFKLMDSILSAKANRVFKIVSSLRSEGVAAPIVLWALTREARALSKIKQSVAAGQSLETAFRNNQIWDKRKALVNSALARLSDNDLNSLLVLSAKADRQIKGQQAGNAWETVLQVCLIFASARAGQINCNY